MRKHTRRKVWPLVDPMAHAKKGASVVAERQALSSLVWRLFHDLRQGKMVERAAFDDLTRAILVGDRLRRFDLARKNKPEFHLAMEAINAIRERKSGLDHYVSTAGELEALRDVLLVVDVQLNTVSVSEFQEAWRSLQASEMTIHRAKDRKAAAAAQQPSG